MIRLQLAPLSARILTKLGVTFPSRLCVGPLALVVRSPGASGVRFPEDGCACTPALQK